MIPELEIGRLTVDLPAHGLRAGDTGVVVLVHARREVLAYEVEFFTPEGETIDIVTVRVDQMEPLPPRITRAPNFAGGRLSSDLPEYGLLAGEVGKLLAVYDGDETYLVQFYNPEQDSGLVTYVDRAQLELLNTLPAWAVQTEPAAASG